MFIIHRFVILYDSNNRYRIYIISCDKEGVTMKKIRIAGTMYDRRRKLDEETKELIREEYLSIGVSQRTLAKKYGISKTSVLIIVNPEYAERQRVYNKEYAKDHYCKDKYNSYNKATQRYKRQLRLEGKIREVGNG
jgi:DNA invertase Pin-like site-specific DNA recombinase